MLLVNDWVGDVLKNLGNDIYRMKGVLAVAGSPKKFVYQVRPAASVSRASRQWRLLEFFTRVASMASPGVFPRSWSPRWRRRDATPP